MATLRISDLSVGDWVGIDQAELNMPSDYLATAYIEKLRKPIRIKGISADSDMVIADIEIVDEWGSIMMKCEYLRPIPITAEILETNGFECIEEDADTALYGTPSCSIFHTKGALRYRLETPQASVVCWNIHDLQHALRLAGVDKEINL